MEITCNKIEKYSKRFWSKVDIRGDNECWEWRYCKQSKGYGSVGIGNGKTALAHRVAYQLAKEETPDGLIVCHSCDNRTCCNPNHLWLGTIADNNRDMVSKGRNATGEKSGRAKLTFADVMKMRAIYSAGNSSYSDIAKEFRITSSWARSVIKGDYWKLPLAE
jgi:hypothetical protein